MNENARILRWIGRTVGLSLNNAMWCGAYRIGVNGERLPRDATALHGETGSTQSNGETEQRKKVLVERVRRPFECCCRRERHCAAGSSVWIDRHRRTTSRRDGPVVDPLPSDAVGSVDELGTWRSRVFHDHHDPGVEMSLGMIDVG